MAFICSSNCLKASLCSVLVALVAASVLFFAIHHPPTKVNFHVTHASLAQLNITGNGTTLHYDLALNLTARNPNRFYSVYYDAIEVVAYYENEEAFSLGTVKLKSFYQGMKSTAFLRACFKGQNDLKVIHNIDNLGLKNIVVKLYVRNKYFSPSTRNLMTWQATSETACYLEVPLGANYRINGGEEPEPAGFRATRFEDKYRSFSFPIFFLACIWISSSINVMLDVSHGMISFLFALLTWLGLLVVISSVGGL